MLRKMYWKCFWTRNRWKILLLSACLLFILLVALQMLLFVPPHELNFCATEDGRLCHPKATCHINSRSFICHCNNGYRGDGYECEDVNECHNNSSGCHENAVCINTDGSYTCQCKDGYVDDGERCSSSDRHKESCILPVEEQYQDCVKRANWLLTFWEADSCFEDNGVDGSLCSILNYLSEIEGICPQQPSTSSRRLPFRKTFSNQVRSIEVLDKYILHDKANLQWIFMRISNMWEDWISTYRTTKISSTVVKPKKKILLFLGILAEKEWYWAENAKHGGPLGELVQWADLIAALYIFGFQILVATNIHEIHESIKEEPSVGCGKNYMVTLENSDVIFVDIHGMRLLMKNFDSNKFRCKVRILDSFGTEARFNHKSSELEEELNIMEKILSLQDGSLHLHLNQYMTMFRNFDLITAQKMKFSVRDFFGKCDQIRRITFTEEILNAHSPDNSFLGFVVGKENLKPISSKDNVALVYGKKDTMWKGFTPILAILQEFFEVHGTVIKRHKHNRGIYNLPRFVQNHGLMEWDKLQMFLEQRVKIFVGLGYPFEGPAPLEAIGKGAVFLNPKWDPPLSRENDKQFEKKWFFKDKPTLRKFKSQHPYLEKYVGKPNVYTVDYSNKTQLRVTLQEIVNNFKLKKIQPYLPFEFTYEGYMERLYIYVTKQNFCGTNSNTSWMPLLDLFVKVSHENESCQHLCERKGLVCENSMFPDVNTILSFQHQEMTCRNITYESSLVAPYYTKFSQQCVLQKDNLLHSCVDKSEEAIRLCPCRTFITEQIALSPHCR